MSTDVASEWIDRETRKSIRTEDAFVRRNVHRRDAAMGQISSKFIASEAALTTVGCAHTFATVWNYPGGHDGGGGSTSFVTSLVSADFT